MTFLFNPYTLRVIGGAMSFALLYPQLREGVRLGVNDARAVLDFAREFGGSSDEQQNLAATTTTRRNSDQSLLWIPGKTHAAFGLRIGDLLSAAAIAVEAYTAYEESKAIKEALGAIAGQIKITNNLIAGGSSGPDGFARHVLDFVELRIRKYTADGKQHRFFLYHPHSQWHGAFARLSRTEGFAPDCFLGMGRDLFAVARLMLCARIALQETMGDEEAKKVVFHLLIPSFHTIVIAQPFRLVDALFPLTIDSETAQDYLIWLNFPYIPRGTLVDIGNISDLSKSTLKQDMAGMGACIGTMSAGYAATIIAIGTAMPVSIPLGLAVYVGGSLLTPVVASKVGVAASEIWEEEEPPPALLG